jgi:hypothetical protein
MITTIDYILDKISYLGDQKNKGYEKYKSFFLGKMADVTIFILRQ